MPVTRYTYVLDEHGQTTPLKPAPALHATHLDGVTEIHGGSVRQTIPTDLIRLEIGETHYTLTRDEAKQLRRDLKYALEHRDA